MSNDTLETLKRDAERYRWLRDQHWSLGTLSVVRADSLSIGMQTYSAENLDRVVDVERSK